MPPSKTVVQRAKVSVLFACMIMQRTSQNHKRLIFNVNAFYRWGWGVNQNAKVYGANSLFLKKIFKKEKRKKSEISKKRF